MYFKHEIGFQSENKVIQYYLKKNWKLIKWRWQTPYAEVDLLFVYEGKYKIVEVKTSSCDDFKEFIVNRRQRKRLIKVREWLESKLNSEVELELAVVSKNKPDLASKRSLVKDEFLFIDILDEY